MRIFRYIFIVLFLFMIPISVGAKEKAKVIFFWGNGCEYCEAAMEFFDSIEEEYGDYFEVEDYEVWYNESNAKLKDKVVAYLKDNSNGVPYIVIGKTTFGGYMEEWNDEIIKAIMNEYNNNDRTDIIAEANDFKESGPNYIVALVFLVLMGGFVTFLCYGKKN